MASVRIQLFGGSTITATVATLAVLMRARHQAFLVDLLTPPVNCIRVLMAVHLWPKRAVQQTMKNRLLCRLPTYADEEPTHRKS